MGLFKKKEEEVVEIQVIPTSSEIREDTKKKLDRIVFSSQETSYITQLYHSAMEQYQEVIDYHAGIPHDSRYKYPSVANSPEVFEDIKSNIRLTQKDFFAGSEKMRHPDMMMLFADELRGYRFYGDDPVVNIERYGILATDEANVYYVLPSSHFKQMYDLGKMFRYSSLDKTADVLDKMFGNVLIPHASKE